MEEETERGGRPGEVKRKLSVGGKRGGTLSVVGRSSSPAHTALTKSMSEALCSEQQRNVIAPGFAA